jgi:hypothetical protein
MSTFLEIIAPNINLESDHDHFSALEVKYDLAKNVKGLEIIRHTPALISDHGKHSPEVVTAEVLKLIRSLPAREATYKGDDENFANYMALQACQSANHIGAKNHRGAGTCAIVSVNMFYMIQTHNVAMDVNIRADENLRDDEMIVTYHRDVNESVVDGGLAVVKLPDGDAMLCQLPNWENYYEYVNFSRSRI